MRKFADKINIEVAWKVCYNEFVVKMEYCYFNVTRGAVRLRVSVKIAKTLKPDLDNANVGMLNVSVRRLVSEQVLIAILY